MKVFCKRCKEWSWFRDMCGKCKKIVSERNWRWLSNLDKNIVFVIPEGKEAVKYTLDTSKIEPKVEGVERVSKLQQEPRVRTHHPSTSNRSNNSNNGGDHATDSALSWQNMSVADTSSDNNNNDSGSSCSGGSCD